jgi:hypothetical protein
MRVSRQRIILIAGLTLALAFTLFFGFRFARRILFRPSREPIRAWQSLPYIARSYGIPPKALHDALGLPQDQPDRRPIGEIARSLNRNVDEMIAVIEKRIEVEDQARRQRRRSIPQISATPPP